MWRTRYAAIALVCGAVILGVWWSQKDAQQFWSQGGRTGIHKAPFFGEVEQIQVTTDASLYTSAYLTASYPAEWVATTGTKWLDLPARVDEAWFAPQGNTVGHTAALSGASIDNVQRNAIAREKAHGRTLDAEEDITVGSQAVRKLSFSRPGAREDKTTYYIYDGAPLRVLAATGPGDLTLDEGTKLILRTLQAK